MNNTILKVEELNCGYGKKPVISDISFEVKSGEKLCVLGRNGCGKSTLLKALCGLLKYSGSVYINGKNLAEMNHRQRAREAALMSQFAPAAFDFTVEECVSTGRYAHESGRFNDFERGEDLKIIEECMRFTGVDDLAGKLLTELSGGQLQRVFLARTFAQDPGVLLLDEPMNHLDISAQKQLSERINEWIRHRERCAIAVFHDISLALNFADKILLMKDGKILSLSSSDKLDERSLNEAYGIGVRSYMRELYKRWE